LNNANLIKVDDNNNIGMLTILGAPAVNNDISARLEGLDLNKVGAT
jgi:hypothetical protein